MVTRGRSDLRQTRAADLKLAAGDGRLRGHGSKFEDGHWSPF